MKDWKRHEDDPELQKRRAFKDKQVQRLRKLENDAANPPPPTPKKKVKEDPGPPPDFPTKPDHLTEEQWSHLFRGPQDNNRRPT